MRSGIALLFSQGLLLSPSQTVLDILQKRRMSPYNGTDKRRNEKKAKNVFTSLILSDIISLQ